MKITYYNDSKIEGINLGEEFGKKDFYLLETNDYAEVVCDAKKKKIDILILNSDEYFAKQKAMNIFSLESFFCVPVVLLGKENNQYNNCDLPSNYRLVEYEKIVEEVNYYMQGKLSISA